MHLQLLVVSYPFVLTITIRKRVKSGLTGTYGDLGVTLPGRYALIIALLFWRIESQSRFIRLFIERLVVHFF